MRRNQTSLTAAGIAAIRAIESERPEDERLLHDPYARQFVPGWLFGLTAFFIRSGLAEWRGPGVVGYLAARERYIDDVLETCLGEGLQQLVILGAGYDARAHRINALKEKVEVFEVDLPATQVDKVAKVLSLFGALPPHVTYVAVDLSAHILETRLKESGYDPTRKTLFIWQGATMYLTAAAVDETLRFVARNSANGSAIVFDYLYRAALEGIQPRIEVINMRRYRFMTGEQLTFGIEAGAIETLLKQHGLRMVREVNARDLTRAYCTGKNTGRQIASGYGIVLAEV